MRKHDIIWAAGLFDGEGCISIKIQKPTPRDNKKSNSYLLQVSVDMCDKKTVYRLRDIFKVGSISKSIPKPPRHTYYRWTAVQREAYYVLLEMSPYLFTKRNECFIAMKFMLIPNCKYHRGGVDPEITKKRHSFYLALRKQKLLNFEESKD